MRLLADKETKTESTARAWSVSKTEDAIIAHFEGEGMLTPDESRILKYARGVRNKILHSEYHTAIEILEEFRGKSFPAFGVTMIKLDKSENVLEQILAAVDGKKEPAKVSDLPPEQGKLFGWLLHIAGTGALNEAIACSLRQLKLSIEYLMTMRPRGRGIQKFERGASSLKCRRL